MSDTKKTWRPRRGRRVKRALGPRAADAEARAAFTRQFQAPRRRVSDPGDRSNFWLY